MRQSNKPLKYIGYSIVFQEVPNEVSLAINVSGCTYKCRGCHSRYLWNYNGEFMMKNLNNIIQENLDFITCVCFMGGDQNQEELLYHLKYIRDKYGLKTCLYTGCDDITQLNAFFPYLNYLKVGRYNEELGGLNALTTNQKMYQIKDGKIHKDITSLFQNRRLL